MHQPVLLKEVLEYLNPQPGGVFIDATINGGGHAQAIAEKIGKTGKLLGIDRDCVLIEKLKVSSFKFQVSDYTLVCDTFANIKTIAEKEGFTNADGILFDLGFSSFHIDSSGRGFSFKSDEPLDMRYNTREGMSAAELINSISEQELYLLLHTFGEERYARQITQGIVHARMRKFIERTGELVEIIQKSVPPSYRKQRIHCATRTFQALRIRVNDELEHVAKGIRDAVKLLQTHGRTAVISFHSGEDRLVKQIYKDLENETIVKRITKHVIKPSREECIQNPRSRSAKMRVVEYTNHEARIMNYK